MQYPRGLKLWLIIGVVMVFFQIIIGGITRLTGSGLSITKWEIVTGTLPPMNATQWEHEFDLYKLTPQYQKINKGMSLKEFKFIYFWEYFHRLWARTMGFVFLIPFFYFWFKGNIDKSLLRKLGIVIVLALIVASFGWIMVASGLIERPWVNAYKLTIHLALGFTLFAYLLWTTYETGLGHLPKYQDNRSRKWIFWILVITGFQLILGGLMSGMKAGLFYPTWPDMNGSFIPSELFQAGNWKLIHLTMYDEYAFAPALVQALHRLVAYLLVIFSFIFFFHVLRTIKEKRIRIGSVSLILAVVLQSILGIFTVIQCKGSIPVSLGVLHQAGAIIFLSAALYLYFIFNETKQANFELKDS
jgi:cytochrome c oxidase assembly protein subunit 15